MKNLKILLIAGVVIAVVAIVTMIYFVSTKEKVSLIEPENLKGVYTINNEDFGYKFDVSDEYFSRYQENRQGYSVSYSIPYRNADGTEEFTNVFAITATPKDIADVHKKLCAQGKETAPMQCNDYANSLGENNLFYFNFYGSQESALLSGDANDLKRMEKIIAEANSKLEFYNARGIPTTLTYEVKNEGYEYKYPAYLDNTFGENQASSIDFDFGADGVTSINPGLVKNIPVKYCGPSGKCEPTTTNFKVTIGSIFISEKQLLQTELGKSLTKVKIGNYVAYYFNLGAEGEGIDHYLVVSPLKDQITLVAHKYIDETVVRNYQNVKDFTTYREQKKVTGEIIKSLSYFEPFK